MKKTHYLTTTIQKGHRLDLHIPELEEGQNVEIIIIVPENETINDNENNARKNKTLATRRKLMEKQAEAMKKYYEEDQSWREWVNLDLGEIYN